MLEKGKDGITIGKQKKLYEVDLYEPIKAYFTELDYLVHGEVKDCDVVAVKGEELVIIELKLSLQMDLLIQATKRQRLTKDVYLAIPEPNYNIRSRKANDLRHVLRRLELGLITVSFEKSIPEIDVIMEPATFNRKKSMSQSNKRKNQVLKEVAGRTQDYNVGGSYQTKLMTAYKENCIYIACCLRKFGPLSAKVLREIGTGDKTYNILYKNYYKWFKRVDKGIYGLAEKGAEAFAENEQIIEHYEALIADYVIEE